MTILDRPKTSMMLILRQLRLTHRYQTKLILHSHLIGNRGRIWETNENITMRQSARWNAPPGGPEAYTPTIV
jgi:hypothetical protein